MINKKYLKILDTLGKEKQDIEYEIDERYDEGGVEQKKAPFDYTKFFRNDTILHFKIEKNLTFFLYC